MRPWLLGGMTALCVARPLFPSESAALQGDGLAMVMLWIALGVFWLLGAIGRPRFAIRFGWTDAAVLLLLGWHTAAALWATRHGSPRPAVNVLWEWIGMGLCFLLARQFIATPRESRALAAVMVALAVALSGYGLYQYAYELPHTQAKYEADPDRALRNAGLWYPPKSPERQRFESRLHNPEPIATFALTNSLAAFLTPWLVVLAGMACSSGRNRKRLFGMAVCALPIAACLLLTKSRSAYVAAAVGLMLVWPTCRARTAHIRWKWPVAVLAVGIVLVAVMAGIRGNDQDLLARASKSFGYRLQYWQSSGQMIAAHPIIGCGPGNFQSAYTRYKLPEASEEVADPHNFLLEIWATAGTPAALALLAVLGCFAGAVWRVQGSGFRVQGRGTEDERWAVQRPGNLAASAQSEIHHPPSAIQRPTADGWRHVIAGGVIGILLSVPVGLLGAAPPGAAVVLMGLPLAAATIALLRGWIREGRLPRSLSAVAVAALLVDLLATGGIGMPSVAGTLWLLMAVGLQGERPRELHSLTAWAALTAAIGLAVACYGTAYGPVLAYQAEMRAAERERESAVEHLETASRSDPLASEPWRLLAATYFERWWQTPGDATFGHFEEANAQALKRAPNSAPAWLAAGDWYFRASSQTERHTGKPADELIQTAVAAYRQAVSLYPNNAVYRAKLAVASRASGDQPAFRREARLALQLDEATPHADKKLPAELRDRLLSGLGGTP